MHDPLGDTCKAYERATISAKIPATGWLVARLDGRSFSKKTRSLIKPFDARFHDAMQEATVFVMKDTKAIAAFHQSDEVSLFWNMQSPAYAPLYANKRDKILSLLAGAFSAALFKALLARDLSKMADTVPHVDARLMHVRDSLEAARILAWRAQDAQRNSVSSLARFHYSSRDMHKKNQATLKDMIAQKDDMAAYPDVFFQGSCLNVAYQQAPLSPQAIAQIPADKNITPNATYWRRGIDVSSTRDISDVNVAHDFLRLTTAQVDIGHARKKAAAAI